MKEDGQITIFVLGMTIVAIAVTALAVDGTRAFLMRRSLQSSADAAALAAAAEIDVTSYHSSGGGTVRLDARRAGAVATRWLAMRGIDLRSRVSVEPDGVEVAVSHPLRTSFLRFVGIHRLMISTVARAEPVAGSS